MDIDKIIRLAQNRNPIKVVFKQQIHEDFVEPGMMAWFTKFEYEEDIKCYNLIFNLSEFEEENLKYFTETFYPTRKTKAAVNDGTLPEKEFYTAIQAGWYTPRYEAYFGGDISEKDMLTDLFTNYITMVE